MSIQWWKCVFTLCVFVALMPAQERPRIEGEWNGTIAGKLRVIFQIDKSGDNTFKGVMESVDQGHVKLPIDAISLDSADAVRFEWKDINAAYDAKLSSDGAQLDGTWQQGGARLPLTLRRAGTGPVAATLKEVIRGKILLKPCLAVDGGTQALCGTYEVFENRASRTGRKIALNILIMPAQSNKPAPDPVFAFAGGPGESAVSAFPMAMFARALQKDRDIVLIDQRGAGKSNPLTCPLDLNDAQKLISDPYPLQSLAACRTELEKRADLTQYTTDNSIDDVDEVREALGYDRVNVLGGSYGSLAGLVYIRRHGSHVRSVALEAVAPPDYRLPLEFARTIQSSLERLFANCASDAGCSKSFPNLRTEFETIVKRLDKEPAKFEFKAGGDEKPQSITMGRGPFVTALRALLYQPGVVRQLPYVLHRAYENDWSPYATFVVGTMRAVGDGIARGLSYSVSCAESIPFISEADVKRETGGTYLGDFDVRKYQRKCAAWPHASVSKEFLAPVRSDIPVLLIAGEEDPATPPWLAERAAKELSHARVVKIPNGTHLTSAACTDNLIAEFIRAGSEKQLNDECVSQIRRPAFVTLEDVKRAQGGSSGN